MLENPVASDDPGRAIKLAVALAQHGADRLVVKRDVPTGGVSYILAANKMDAVQRSDLATLADAQGSVASLVEDRSPT